MNQTQLDRITSAQGFIAALDQSGGSTPKALSLYGIAEDAYATEAEMFDLMHAMRTRMMISPAFDGRRILGAILFEGTMDREVEGVGTATYLWETKRVVPFLKVDKGLTDVEDGVQMMKPNPGLGTLLERASQKGIFGTKMRSVIKEASAPGIARVVAQQFEVGLQILDAGLIPIIEPEVDIKCADKARAESILRDEIGARLDAHRHALPVMLKLTLPETDDFYAPFVGHTSVARVVALSGGYSREESNSRLARNHGVVASFSRALTEGLSASQTDAEFDAALDASIESIYRASIT